MNKIIDAWTSFAERLEGLGAWLAPLGLRLILAWEFWEAGREKFSGSNWFMQIQGDFPFPFNLVPASLSWSLATWTELLGALALLFGFSTRIAAFSLFVLTIVATAAVHWPDDAMMFGDLLQGYDITDKGHGNYKLPLLFLVMLVPLILRGAGKLSLDALLSRATGADARAEPIADGIAWGLAAVALGLPLAMLLPMAGFVLAIAGVVLLAVSTALHR